MQIKEILEKAKKGSNICIGFIGGSITQGAVASSFDKCYAYRVYQWFCDTFPQSTFQYVNAGIGATDSQFACARIHEDLLKYKPDFCIVEFSVNDENNAHYKETYEGLIRSILSSEDAPAVLLFSNMFYDSGNSAIEIHREIALHYQLDWTSIKEDIFDAIQSGKLQREALTTDNLHPNDYGHGLVAKVITDYLEKIVTSEIEGHNPMLAKPITNNRYEKTYRINNNNSIPVENTFQIDRSKQSHITDIFKNGWYSQTVGDRIVFKIDACCAAVQYRKTILKPAPIAKLILDHDNNNAIILDANFEETWGDKLYLQQILDEKEKGSHTIEIIITDVPDNVVSPFYLVSILTA